jgi:hypothetical protein
MQSQDESWTDMFTRKSMEKNRSRRPLTEEQYLALERETDGEPTTTIYVSFSSYDVP